MLPSVSRGTALAPSAGAAVGIYDNFGTKFCYAFIETVKNMVIIKGSEFDD